MKYHIFIFLFAVLLLFIGCSDDDVWKETMSPAEPDVTISQPTPSERPQSAATPEESVTEAPSTMPSASACQFNSNCTTSTYCINGACQALPKSSQQALAGCRTCRVTSVDVYTSDKETYSVPPGQGSYTAAGALEWTIISPGSYCQGSKPAIAFKILTKNYNKVYRDDTIIVEEGKTSAVIKHDLIKDIAFTLKVAKISEECA